MGTEVLRPQDCLIERFRAPPAALFHRRKTFYNSYHYKPSRSKPAPVRFDHKRKATADSSSSMISRRHSSDDLRQSKNNRNHYHHPVNGQVTLLRRGKGMEPMPPKQMWINDPDMYAGSATFVSPAPESLPLPSFSKKKQASVAVDDWATRDLRRLLGLD